MPTIDSSFFLLVAADAILLLHVLFVVFVVAGLVLIFAGKAFSWSWVRNPWFRVAHLIAICIVVAQSWFGVICPLTSWEMSIRSRASDAVYSGSFISHWLETILYYQAPAWVFVVCYSAFWVVVVVSWFWVRPHPFTKQANHVAP